MKHWIGDSVAREIAWAGVDIGKTHHWVCVVDSDGTKLWSAKLVNDESELTAVIMKVSGLAEQVVWTVDIVSAPAALLLALLAQAGHPVRYAPGRMVAAMSAAYAGEGKTDSKDAFLIAETARIRRDLTVIDQSADLTRNLGLLIAHRNDLTADRVRMINRLRDVMTSVFPSLEREFDYSSCKGALVLLTGYATSQQIRRIGLTRLTSWLQRRRVRNFAQVAARAVAAAQSQHIVLPGQDIAAEIITELATAVLTLDARVVDLDKQITEVFRCHRDAASIESMPGFGPILGAMLLATTGDLRAFPSAGHMAAAAGLVPVPNDSGRRAGNLHRPRRYSRPLRHAFYLAAQTSSMRAGPNRDYYLLKREHGRTHTQAIIALARRRVDVLWALLRDQRCYTIDAPSIAKTAA